MPEDTTPTQDIKTVTDEIVKRLVESVSGEHFAQTRVMRTVRTLTLISRKTETGLEDYAEVFSCFSPGVTTLEAVLASRFATLIPWNLVAKQALDILCQP